MEWLIGLPVGWITDPMGDLTANQQNTALGNGVLPLQALLALRSLGLRMEPRRFGRSSTAAQRSAEFGNSSTAEPQIIPSRRCSICGFGIAPMISRTISPLSKTFIAGIELML